MITEFGPAVLATLVLALAVGLSLGLLGGGGSILMVPIFVYVTGLDAKEAIASSLVVVGVTSAVASVRHARKGRVRWRTGLIFGVAGIVGAFLGGRVGGVLPGELLLALFGLMMLATSTAMIRGRKTPNRPAHTELPIVRVLVDGLVVGLVTGLVGAGGGFLVVPALALLGGLPMSVAVGTSLVVIAMKSVGGLAGYLNAVSLDWTLLGGVTVMAVLGSFAGSLLVGRIDEGTLRKGFGWFVLVMGVFVLAQQLPPAAVVPVLGGVVLIAAAAAVCWFLVPACPLRRLAASEESDKAEVSS